VISINQKFNADFLMKRVAKLRAGFVFRNILSKLSQLPLNFTLNDKKEKLENDPLGKYLIQIELPSRNKYEKLDKLITKQIRIMGKIINRDLVLLSDMEITNKFLTDFEKEITEIYTKNTESYDNYLKELMDNSKYTETLFDISTTNDESDDEDFDLDTESEKYETKKVSFMDLDLNEMEIKKVSSDKKIVKLNEEKSTLKKSYSEKKSSLSFFGKLKMKNNLDSGSDSSSYNIQEKKPTTFLEIDKYENLIFNQIKLFNKITESKLNDSIFQIEFVNHFLNFFENDLKNLK
jgi:hypothetical protein